MKKISILVADDNAMVRQSFRFIFEEDERFMFLGECKTGREALDKTYELHPDVVVMDINLPDISGCEATLLIRQISPGTSVLGASMHTQPEFVESILKNGAMGYITKTSPVGEIIKAAIEVSSGRKYICDEIERIFPGKNPDTNEK